MQTRTMRIYHRSEAAAPELHTDQGEWYFEPLQGLGLEVFSVGYPTAEAALAAAEEWEAEQAGEAAAEELQHQGEAEAIAEANAAAAVETLREWES